MESSNSYESCQDHIIDPELTNVVIQLRLKDYVSNFRKNRVTFSDLPNLTDEELERIIPQLVPRNRLKQFIRENFIQKKKGDGWEIDSELVTPCDKSVVSEGNFGVIKKGEIKFDGTTISVACKEIIIDGVVVLKEKVIDEVRMMSMCHHPNVLKCFGCYFSKDQKVATICLEYLPEGDLLKLANRRELSPFQKLIYLLEIAKGLKYLHDKNIVHRDIKPANILLSRNLRSIKICDFGAAKISKQVRGTVIGTPAYLAPELFKVKKKIKEPKKIDVYSFGILMWELFCDEIPFHELQKKYHDDPYSFLVTIHGATEETVKKGISRRSKKLEEKQQQQQQPLRPNTNHKKLKKVSEIEELIHLIESCWDAEPVNRPCFFNIVQELGEFYDEMKKYPEKYHNVVEVNQFNDHNIENFGEQDDDEEEEGEEMDYRNNREMDGSNQVLHQLFGIRNENVF